MTGPQRKPNRWNKKESELLLKMRETLRDKLKQQKPFPEVVGDRRLIRFLRGKQHNLKVASEAFEKFLDWRKDNKIDDIRQDIVYGGKNSPMKPFGLSWQELDR